MSRISRINSKIKEINPSPKFTDYLFFYNDLILSRLFIGVNILEYFEFGYYTQSWMEKKNNFSHRNRRKIINKYCKNKDKIVETFIDKKKFNILFGAQLKREWLDLSKADFETAEAFMKKHKIIACKKNWLCEGQGFKLYTYTDTESAKKIYDEYSAKDTDGLFEEYIVQNHEMAEFCNSVNTIRIITLLHNGIPHIICAAMRMGIGESEVDNFDAGGLACDVDAETGIVTSVGKNAHRKSFLIHPVTKKQIIGFKIPNWEKAVKLVKEAALVYPDCGWVGWDVAITENDAVLVEGNYPTGIIQINKFDNYKKVKALMKST